KHKLRAPAHLHTEDSRLPEDFFVARPMQVPPGALSLAGFAPPLEDRTKPREVDSDVWEILEPRGGAPGQIQNGVRRPRCKLISANGRRCVIWPQQFALGWWETQPRRFVWSQDEDSFAQDVSIGILSLQPAVDRRRVLGHSLSGFVCFAKRNSSLEDAQIRVARRDDQPAILIQFGEGDAVLARHRCAFVI